MPSKKGSQKSPSRGPKPAKVPDSASNRIKDAVKDREAEMAAKKAAKEDSDRAEAVLREEELKQRLSQEASSRSDSSQPDVGLAGPSLPKTFSAILTKKQIAAMLKSALAKVSVAGGPQELSDLESNLDTILFPSNDLSQKKKSAGPETGRGKPPMANPSMVRKNYLRGGENNPSCCGLTKGLADFFSCSEGGDRVVDDR
jgi:hypothetical protein